MPNVAASKSSYFSGAWWKLCLLISRELNVGEPPHPCSPWLPFQLLSHGRPLTAVSDSPAIRQLCLSPPDTSATSLWPLRPRPRLSPLPRSTPTSPASLLPFFTAAPSSEGTRRARGTRMTWRWFYRWFSGVVMLASYLIWLSIDKAFADLSNSPTVWLTAHMSSLENHWQLAGT